jgi:hypothetical protein
MIEFLVLLAVAGSLEELQNQVTGAQSYREELASYIVSHNMSILDTRTLGGLPNSAPEAEALGTWSLFSLEELKTWDVNLLEETAKKHIQACEYSGNKSVIYLEFTRKGDC